LNGKGRVYIIGAGPGDGGLLTIKAAECIRKADVLVYDRLIGRKVISYAREDAELVYVGKMPESHPVPQDVINRILLEKALEGKAVARIKGGDPFVFGRGGEEAEFLRENGVEYEIVPGVTSAISVPAYAGIPVTHRDCCSSLHIITGHEKSGTEGGRLDYSALAKLEGTLVFLMGVKNLHSITENLIRHGKAADTPAAVIENGTTAMQRLAVGTIENICRKAAELGINSPAVTVVGKTAALAAKLKWFPHGPLAGKRIVVTRTRGQAGKLSELIGEKGGEAIELPAIKIREPEDFTAFDNALDNLARYKWVVFTSGNGVEAFLNRMKRIGADIRMLYGIKLCAVGPSTADRLIEAGLRPDFVPESYTTGELLKGVRRLAGPGERVLLARADIAGAELSEGLRECGIEFDELAVYRTSTDSRSRDEALELFGNGRVDCITFTSSSTVRGFIDLLGRDRLELAKGARVVCIGPVTADAARKLGMRVDAIADEYTIEGLVKKLVEVLEVM